jgi:hypothetical protein
MNKKTKSSSWMNNGTHHLNKLFEVNFSVPVPVHLLDNMFNLLSGNLILIFLAA